MFAKHFGCARFMFNWGLSQKIEHYQIVKNNKDVKYKSLSLYDLQKKLTALKKDKDHLWLNEVNSQSLTQSLRHLDLAYRKFFKEKKGFPKFKSKTHSGSFYSHQGNSIDADALTLNIMKIKNIPIKFHRKCEGEVHGVTIAKTASGKYYASISVRINEELPFKPKINIEKAVKVELNEKHPYIAIGDKIVYGNFVIPNILKRMRVLNKRLSRKTIGSRSCEKTRITLAKLQEKISYQRSDFLHNLSKKIVTDNKNIMVKTLAVSDNLLPTNRKKTRDKNRNLLDKGLFEFQRQLTYKGDWYGSNVILNKPKS